MSTAKGSWKRSGRCTGQGAGTCVELCPDDNGICFRDSKDLAVPALTFSMEAVRTFFAQIGKGRVTDFDGLIQVSRSGEDYLMCDSRGGSHLTFSSEEMVAFYGGVRDGDFDTLLKEADSTITSMFVRA